MGNTQEIDSRIIRMVLVDGTQINGQVNIRRKPGHDRVSDLVTSGNEDFLVVYTATMYKSGKDEPIKHPVIFVNKRHILYAAPEEAQK